MDWSQFASLAVSFAIGWNAVSFAQAWVRHERLWPSGLYLALLLPAFIALKVAG